MKKDIFNISVPPNCHGYRIDKFLQSHSDKTSRTKIQNLIREGFVKLNDKTIKEVSKKIKTNDKIRIIFPPPKETHIRPQKIPLDILYEDNDIIIINKSPGVVVHPGSGNPAALQLRDIFHHSLSQPPGHKHRFGVILHVLRSPAPAGPQSP